MSSTWNRFFFSWNDGRDAVYWLENHNGSVKKCHKKISVQVLALNVILNLNSGFSTPHVLVSTSQLRGTHGTFEILSFSGEGTLDENSWLKVGTLELSKQQCRDGTEFHLLDGPRVIWTTGSCINVASGTSMKSNSLDLNSVLPESSKVDGIIKVWCESQQGPSPLIRLGIQAHLKQVSMREFGDREWFCVEINMNGVPTLSLVPDFIPSCYGMIATCMVTCTEFVFDQLAGSLRERVRRVIGTELEQVVMVEDGLVEDNVLSLDYVPHKLLTLAVSAKTTISYCVMSLNLMEQLKLVCPSVACHLTNTCSRLSPMVIII